MKSIGLKRGQSRAVGKMAARKEYYFDCESSAKEECGSDPRKLIIKIVASYCSADANE
jgi:hypothetical protein